MVSKDRQFKDDYEYDNDDNVNVNDNEYDNGDDDELSSGNDKDDRKHWRIEMSGDNLLKNRSPASASEYKQLPINLQLFQISYCFQINFSRKTEIEN